LINYVLKNNLMEIAVRNPRTGIKDYFINAFDKEKISGIVENMRLHQKKWNDQGIDYRVRTMKKWLEVLDVSKDEIIQALTEDTGRYPESVLEYNLLPTTINRWIIWSEEFFSLNKDKNSQVPNIYIKQENIPYSVVGVISPWNFPLLLSIIDTIPALLGGCSVLVKPSEITPRFIKPLQVSIDKVPELHGILQYIEGDGTTGAELIELADIICFTGSVATGRKVYHQCANLFKPCFLELGGKDAAIVLKGADLQKAAKSILWGSIVNCGHSCLSIERVYVHKDIIEEFIILLKSEADKVTLALENPESGQIGPVISERQVAIIDEHLNDALQKGAKIISGERICRLLNGGYYCRPVILTNVNHSMNVMTEETFGPIIPVMAFKDNQEAVHLANDTIFGLSGAVFAGAEAEALEIAQQMHAGAISINECALTAIVHDGEKNSFKMSGIGGSRMGPSSLQRFMKRKAYLINQNKGDSAWWF